MHKAESQVASEKEKKEQIRLHLYKLVEDLSAPGASATSVQSFRESNLIYTTYASRARPQQQQQQQQGTAEGGKHKQQQLMKTKGGAAAAATSAYMGGLYSKPKSLAAVNV